MTASGQADREVHTARPRQAFVCLLHDARRVDRRLTSRIASWDSLWARQALPAVESAAERTKLPRPRPWPPQGGAWSAGPRSGE